jgi:truncated hemoglobin YjbI
VARTLHMDMGQQSNRDSRLDGEEAEEEMETDDEADERDLDVSNNVFEKDLDLEAGEEDEEMREFQSTPRVRKVSQGRPMMRMSSIPLPMGQNAQSGWA